MTSYLDRLNLRPFEKRLVVGVAAVLFVVFNAWFVFPHFSDLAQAQDRKAAALKKLGSWQVEVDQVAKYKAAISSLAEGLEVPPEEQQNQFSRAIQAQQAQSGVNVTSTSRTSTRTNEFFLELAQTISVQSGEPQLVDFLFKLGAGSSLIRVRGLTLHPDPPRQQLVANVTLVASYQKNPPKKPAVAAPTAAARLTSPAGKKP
jgi:Tfp pilus assembly protein PilO